MKPTGRLLPLICILVASLSLPACASADFLVPGGLSAEAKLTGTHGYHLTISAATSGVTISAQKEDAAVLYFAKHGKIQGDLIKAWLPGIGRIFLRFHEQEVGHEDQPENCHGHAPIIRRGVFTGWVRIRGERDYTQAESRHLRGKIVRSFHSTCHLPTRGRASSGAVQNLIASAPRGKGVLTFSATSFPFPDAGNPLLLRAALLRERGSMLVVNSIATITKRSASLSIATPARSATVNPPSPFTGTASFQQESAKAFSWTGDLAVELPGIGEVSLAGPKFETALCLGRRCRGDLNESGSGTSIAIIFSRAAAPTPSPWRWPGSPR